VRDATGEEAKLFERLCFAALRLVALRSVMSRKTSTTPQSSFFPSRIGEATCSMTRSVPSRDLSVARSGVVSRIASASLRNPDLVSCFFSWPALGRDIKDRLERGAPSPSRSDQPVRVSAAGLQTTT